MLPSIQQFKKWSLPSKVGYLSFWLGVVGFVLTFALPYWMAKPVTGSHVFVPSDPARTETGSCWVNSLVNTRANAWRCMTDSGIHDPCFQRIDPMADAADLPRIVCGARPHSEADSFFLRLSEPLPRVKRDRAMLGEDSPASAWIVELQNGDVCELASGASAVVLGNRMNYFCVLDEDGSQAWLIGYPLAAGDVWTIQGVVIDRDGKVVDEAVYEVRSVYR